MFPWYPRYTHKHYLLKTPGALVDAETLRATLRLCPVGQGPFVEDEGIYKGEVYFLSRSLDATADPLLLRPPGLSRRQAEIKDGWNAVYEEGILSDIARASGGRLRLHSVRCGGLPRSGAMNKIHF